MSGKGSTARPFSVDADTFASNWELVFGKGKKPDNESDKDDSKDGESAEQK